MAGVGKKIWLINPAAMPPEYEVRIQTLKRAYYLKQYGYDVTIIGGSYMHNTTKNLLDDCNEPYIEKDYDGIKYIHVKNSSYKSNNLMRIYSMLEFYCKLWYYAKSFKSPDYICAHSAIPFGVVSFFISKKIKARLIVDVVDLWPESFVAYGLVKRTNMFVRLAYLAEHWLYKKAEILIFSMEGGKDYILEKNWSLEQRGGVDLKKVYYINNGVDLDDFEYNRVHYQLKDEDLENSEIFKIVYLGSIRLVNNLKRLLDAAKLLVDIKDIKFLIYGDGEEREELEKYCLENDITNVIFKQKWVELKYVPYILSCSSLNILNYMPSPLFRFGASQSKSFQYMASGKPICSNVEMNFCPINKYKIGIAKTFINTEEYAKAIASFYFLPEIDYKEMCKRAKEAAYGYDYKKLTERFIYLIEHKLN